MVFSLESAEIVRSQPFKPNPLKQKNTGTADSACPCLHMVWIHSASEKVDEKVQEINSFNI